MSERVRLETLTARAGVEAAKEWARSTAALYRRCVSEPMHYASQPDKRSLFEDSARELETFASTGIIPE